MAECFIIPLLRICCEQNENIHWSSCWGVLYRFNFFLFYIWCVVTETMPFTQSFQDLYILLYRLVIYASSVTSTQLFIRVAVSFAWGYGDIWTWRTVDRTGVFIFRNGRRTVIRLATNFAAGLFWHENIHCTYVVNSLSILHVHFLQHGTVLCITLRLQQVLANIGQACVLR